MKWRVTDYGNDIAHRSGRYLIKQSDVSVELFHKVQLMGVVRLTGVNTNEALTLLKERAELHAIRLGYMSKPDSHSPHLKVVRPTPPHCIEVKDGAAKLIGLCLAIVFGVTFWVSLFLWNLGLG